MKLLSNTPWCVWAIFHGQMIGPLMNDGGPIFFPNRKNADVLISRAVHHAPAGTEFRAVPVPMYGLEFHS